MTDQKDKLANLANEIEKTPPRAALLMGQAMTQACEAAAVEVEKLAQAARDAADEVTLAATDLSAAIRERGKVMSQDVEGLVTRLRDTAADLEKQRKTLEDAGRKINPDA